jgi:SanA protein
MRVDSHITEAEEHAAASKGDTTPEADTAKQSTPNPEPAAPQRGWAAARDTLSRRRRRMGLSLALFLLAFVTAVPLITDMMISVSASGAVTDRVERIEPKPVALLLGTARRTIQGNPNQYYRARIDAAADLFHSGKVRGILVSGDNATRFYNEPVAMQKDLIALGVPAEFITLDYAGFRTLDSVVRAKEVFGVGQAIIVSQRFHAERAVFLARHFGLDAEGLAAADPQDSGLMKVRAREVLARMVAVIDVVIGRQPKFLGSPETVRLRDAAVPQRAV